MLFPMKVAMLAPSHCLIKPLIGRFLVHSLKSHYIFTPKNYLPCELKTKIDEANLFISAADNVIPDI